MARYNAQQATQILLESDDEFPYESSDSSSESVSTESSDNIVEEPRRKQRANQGIVQNNGRGRGRGRGRVRQTEVNRVDDESSTDEEADDVEPTHERRAYIWGDAGMEMPELPDFRANPGVLIDTSTFTTPYHYFKYFIDTDLMSHMVTETNRYADQYIEANPNLPRHSSVRKWQQLDIPEFEKFLGLTLLMGIVKKPVIDMYWSTHPLLTTDAFNMSMKRDTYRNILRFFHFNNNQNEPNRHDPQRDRMYKIRPLIDILNEKFQAAIQPEQQLSLDETLLLYKGRIAFRQYIPAKRARFGIKIFQLCEATSGYSYKFYIYAGARAPALEMQLLAEKTDATNTDKLTFYMIEPFLGQGYHLYLDNWYTSVRLFKFLEEQSIAACGTLRKNRVPVEIRNMNLELDEVKAIRSGNVVVMKYKAKPTKYVHMLTTIHNQATSPVNIRGRHPREVNKPVAIHDYNRYMNGVDKMDQCLQYYDPTRKTIKWYRKVAIHVIQVALWNSYLVHEKVTHSGMTFLKYILSVLSTMVLNNYEQPNLMNENLVRLTQKHFPTTIPPTATKHNPFRRCKICRVQQGIRKETHYYCASCPAKPALCVDPCFRIYHTEAMLE
jgi:hypothetical protein